MAEPADRLPRPGIPALLLTGATLGGALGCGEALVRILASGTPSVLRRAPGLILTGGILYALGGLVLALLLAEAWVAWARYGRSLSPHTLDAAAFTGSAGSLLLMLGGYLFRLIVPSRPQWFFVPVLLLSVILAVVLIRLLYRQALRLASRSTGGALLFLRLRRVLMTLGVAGILLAGAAALITGGPFGLSLDTPAPVPAAGGTGQTAAAAAATAAATGADAGTRGSPSFLVILIDTLRADHLTCYGSTRKPTPNTCALAARGILFENAYAPCSWTTPSVVSLLTSRFPNEHGVTDFDIRSPASLPNLPGLLAERGYATAAVVSNPLLGHELGFDDGYRLYDTYPGLIEPTFTAVSAASRLVRATFTLPLHRKVRFYPRLGLVYPPRVRIDLSDYVRGDEVTDLTLKALDGLPPGPFFLYVHYGDPHTPYLEHPYGFLPRPTSLEKKRVAQVVERYNDEVAFTDREVGRLIAGVEERGLLEDTVIVFVSDHGEEFQEHRVWEHGHNLHEQALRVPIILAGPGVPRGARARAPVDLLDVAPTVLDLAGAPPGPGFRGRSLLDPWLEGPEAAGRPLLSQLYFPSLCRTRQSSILHEGWRYIRHLDPEGKPVREQLFDRARDPEELRDVSGEERERLAELRERLLEWEAGLDLGEVRREKSEELRERLRSLGYVD